MMQVNPTRMELNRLKGKLKSAQKGHRLLKDKRDALMRQFMEMIRETAALREEVTSALQIAQKTMEVVSAEMQPAVLQTALLLPKNELSVSVSEQNVMSVALPVFSVQQTGTKGSSYGLAMTTGELDDAISTLQRISPKLLRLAQLEKSCQLLADEIERTRRRVSALEHILIPDYEETIHMIAMKLAENERSQNVSLMKVKEMVLEKNRQH